MTIHPLLPAFLYRARLEAVRRQAAVDGDSIDPWHLAAVFEGLRLRMDHALRIIDRGQIFAAAQSALASHQWIVEPDFDQEGEIQEAERHLAAAEGLAGAGAALWSWLEAGGHRPPIRARSCASGPSVVCQPWRSSVRRPGRAPFRPAQAHPTTPTVRVRLIRCFPAGTPQWST